MTESSAYWDILKVFPVYCMIVCNHLALYQLAVLQLILINLLLSSKIHIFLNRFVPYVGIVTILMNDYPKFKVGLYVLLLKCDVYYVS